MDNQTVFNKTYICSTEIIQKLDINRATLSRAIKSELMPKPIVVSNGATHLWLRKEVKTIIKKWAESIAAKRSA